MAKDIKDVPIASLKKGQSPRLDGEDEDHIKRLAAASNELPPILVHAETMHVIDGAHRLRAAQLNGMSTIKAEFFSGGEEEAFIAAVESNIAHGLPLTLSDREAAAKRILKSRPGQSDRWIAATAGISPTTVASIRTRAAANADSLGEIARVGRDGKIRPLSSAAGRLAARQAILENPQAPLRDIAKVSGISPGTARDVRQRMASGESVIPNGETAERHRPVRTRDSATHKTLEVDHLANNTQLAAERVRFRLPEITILLSKLQKDPSIHYTEAGRCLVQSLGAYAKASERCVEAINDIPSHCAYILADFASCCAEEWMTVAKQLRKRLESAE